MKARPGRRDGRRAGFTGRVGTIASRTGALAAAVLLVAAPGASAQDNTPPGPASATVYIERVLRLYTDEDLDRTSLPHPSAFTVKIDGTARPAREVGFCGRDCIAIQTHLTQFVSAGKTVTVSYTKPATNPLQDAAGNETLSFTDFSVDNPFTATVDGVALLSRAGIGRVELDWPAVSGTPPVTKYQWGYYLNSPLDIVLEDVPGGAAARTYIVTGLSDGQEYTFMIRAVNNVGFGPGQYIKHGPLIPNVETPGGFTATGAFRKLNLAWTAPDSTVTVARYQYRLSTDGGDNWSFWTDIPGSDVSTTAYTISDLPDATGYTVELRMRARSVRSDAARTTARTNNLPSGYKGAPGAPTDLRVTLSHSCHVDLYWSAPASNGGKAITKYEFRYRKRNGSFGSRSSDLGDPLLTYVTLGTLACDDYTFEVRAVNTQAGPRASITFTSVDEGRPNEPVELVAAGGFRRVALSWETPRATFNRIDYYQVRYRSGEQPYTSWTRIPNSNYRTTSHTLTGLADETPYDIQVRAVNPEGAGASAQRRATTQALPVDAPSGLTATAGIRKVDLAWTAAASTVAVEAYQYRLSTDAGDTWSDWTDIAGSDATTTRHTVSRLANGTAYTVELRIRAGTSRSAAASRSATTPDVPSAPVLFARPGDRSITLTWRTPGNRGRAITKYQYRRTRASPGFTAWSNIRGSGPTTTSYTHSSGLSDAGRKYTFEVRAVNAVGNGRAGSVDGTTAVSANPTIRTWRALGAEGRDATVDFSVQLHPAANSTVTVDYRTEDNTATAPADYRATDGTLTFAPGETEKTVSVPIVDDAVEDSGEWFWLRLSNVSGALLGDKYAGGWIYNHEDVVAGFTLVDAASGTDVGSLADGTEVTLADPANGRYGIVAQAAPGIGSVRLELTGAKSVAHTDNASPYSLYGDGGGTVEGEALPAGGYTLSGTAYTEADGAGEALGTRTVSFTVKEGDETATTGLPVIYGTPRVGEKLTASVDGIEDEDGLENATFAYQWLSNDGGADTDIEGATDSTYTPVPADAGKTVKVRVTFTDDGGSRETRVSAATDPVAVAISSVLSVADIEAAEEEDSTLDFVVTLDPAASDTVTVDYATSDGTATAGEDYTATSGTLTFQAGDTTKTISVSIADDAEDDGGETFTLTLSNASGADLGDAEATGTIRDTETAAELSADFPESAFTSKRHAGSDDRPQVVVTFSEPVASFDRNTPSVTVTGASALSVQAHTEDGLENAYMFFMTPDGNSDVTFALVADAACASGGICTAGGTVLTQVPAAWTIPGPSGDSSSLSVADAEATEEEDAALEFVVTLTPAASDTVTVHYATSDGTATAGEDYTAMSGTLTFTAGDTRKTISVPITDDTEVDGGETFTLTLSNASGAALGDAEATGTILDDDNAAPLTASFSDMPASHTGEEFTFGLAFSEEVEVGYVTLRDTACPRRCGGDGDDPEHRGRGAADGEFQRHAGLAHQQVRSSRSGWRSAKTVEVATTDDSVAEESETFTLTLSSPANATLGDATATGTINDNDDALPPLTASFSDMPASHTGGEFTFGLAFSEEVEVGYVTLRDTAFAVTGGEVREAQRQQRGSNLAWNITVDPDGQGAVTITLPETTDCDAVDAICTGDERPLSHSLSNVVAGPVIIPTVGVSDASAAEGDAVPFTVSLSAASSQQVTVEYATSDGTATSGADFAAASGTLTFAANETSKTVEVATTDDSVAEESETFTLTLSSPANATLGDATATGTINDNDDALPPLTASFSDMPASHTGGEFTFGLAFSEEVEVGYVTLRDTAFAVTGGEVREAQRQQRGSNLAWNITVEPTSANDTVIITLPETTDCDAVDAICTEDDRPLSHSLSAKVVDAASSSAGDAANGDVADDPLDDALDVLDGVTPDHAAAALVGERTLGEAQLEALDRLGNRNGRYDLGDVLSWRDRCGRGEARCGRAPTDRGPASAAALLGLAAAGRRRTPRRPRRRGSEPRPARRAACALALLLAATTAWSCTGDLVGPAAAERDPGSPAVEQPSPATAEAGPGFLTVEWTAPAAGRATGVLLELEGPGIEAVVGAPGLELYHSAAPGRDRIVVAGSLEDGPLLRFRVPDRGQLARYRVRVLQVTGEDYGLRDVGEYRALVASN
ncbi:Calx-beta domain-containing protein [Candidatus Palauibacter sp.]|uniref:Calx-beta domain-containing protein n=1 Tax=Candidatus Palauibacter sp. TaxID=3101350 RepID=UPI003B5AA8FE